MINKKYRRKTVEIIVKSSDERKLSTPNTRLRIGLVKKKKKKKKKMMILTDSALNTVQVSIYYKINFT